MRGLVKKSRDSLYENSDTGMENQFPSK